MKFLSLVTLLIGLASTSNALYEPALQRVIDYFQGSFSEYSVNFEAFMPPLDLYQNVFVSLEEILRPLIEVRRPATLKAFDHIVLNQKSYQPVYDEIKALNDQYKLWIRGNWTNFGATFVQLFEEIDRNLPAVDEILANRSECGETDRAVIRSEISGYDYIALYEVVAGINNGAFNNFYTITDNSLMNWVYEVALVMSDADPLIAIEKLEARIYADTQNLGAQITTLGETIINTINTELSESIAKGYGLIAKVIENAQVAQCNGE
uniref:CSON005019 protein n=1 Tax=Culicoides sonorensis TaxID=179676 RepID=A0A336K8H9_CULSO